MQRDIARFNQRITFQRNKVIVDKYRNHKNTWTDYYTCWAYASTYSNEKENDSTVVPYQKQTVYFEVRHCSELAGLTSVDYRVVFNGKTYDIEGVDMMNYQNSTIKVRCSLDISRGG